MQQKKIQTHTGFAMLFTVLVVSLILTIALGISNVTFKQTILSNLAKDSQVSFYQADAGVECALYYDLTQNAFPSPTDPATVPSIACGDSTFSVDTAASATDQLRFVQNLSDKTQPCAVITIDKISQPGKTITQAQGYNICQNGPRKVERALRVLY